jgi:hypothetical protein
MRDESGSKDMLEMVDRYSVLREPVTRQTNSSSSTSSNGRKGEAVVSQY